MIIYDTQQEFENAEDSAGYVDSIVKGVALVRENHKMYYNNLMYDFTLHSVSPSSEDYEFAFSDNDQNFIFKYDPVTSRYIDNFIPAAESNDGSKMTYTVFSAYTTEDLIEEAEGGGPE